MRLIYSTLWDQNLRTIHEGKSKRIWPHQDTPKLLNINVFPSRSYGNQSYYISFILKVAYNNHYLIKIFEIELLVDGISFSQLRPAWSFEIQ